MPKLFCRIVATTLSAALIWLSPGLGAVSAFAQNVTGAASAASAGVPVVTHVPTLPSSPYGTGAVISAGVGITNVGNLQLAPGFVPARLTGTPLSAEAGGVAAGMGKAVARPLASGAPVRAGAADRVRVGVAAGNLAVSGPAHTRKTAQGVATVAVGVDAALRAAGPVGELEAGQASGLGARLEGLLTGERALSGSALETGAGAAPLGALRHESGSRSGGISLGKPAGWDSIHRAVQTTGPSGPSAPAPPSGGSRGSDGFGGGKRPPFLARVIASLTALAPALYFGLPLLAVGAVIPGGLLVASGVGLAAMPWVGSSLPKSLLGAPGLAILALGGVTALTIGGWGMAVGGLVTLAGWGFARFARGNRERPGAVEQMSAIFGALAATAAAGLVLTAASGLVAAGATIVSSLFAARLLAELPQWVYEGLGQSINSAVKGTRGIHQVLGSIRTDTVLYDRLVRLTERHVKQYGWFAWVWLGGLWAPALLSEALQWVLSAVAGVALAVVQFPAHFGWGALDEVREKHRLLNRYAIVFANWGRETFSFLQAGKTVWFNPLERRLLPLANSKSRVASLFGGLLLRIAQWGWLASMLAIAVPWQGVLFFHSFWRPSDEYIPEKHSTSALRLPKDPLRDEKPDEKDDPVPPGSEPFFPRLIGAAVGLLPAAFFGTAFLAASAPWFGWAFVAAGAAVAAMPLMPQRTPTWIRVAPGVALGLAGLSAALGGGALLAGALAAFAGWGLANFATKEDSKDRYYYVTDPEYVGAFFGALGALTALGAALAGPAGWLGYGLQGAGALVAGLSIYHLPRWFWSGVRAAGASLGYSPSRVHKVMNFWDDDTDFNRNLKSWWRHWGAKSGWNWWWLWPTLGVKLLFQLYDYAVSAVAGLIPALIRLPLVFAWGAAYRISPKSKVTRFIAGFARGSIDRREGAKATFDKWVAPLIPAINRSAESGRPTLGAALALIAARVVQLAWILRMAVWSPVIFVQAFLDGLRAAREGAPADDQPDKLDPDYL